MNSLYKRVAPQIRCIVLAPTRELAVQVASVFKCFTKSEGEEELNIPDIRVEHLVGQTPFAEECRRLAGYRCDMADDSVVVDSHVGCIRPPDVVVCTPGRFAEHYRY